MLMTILSWIVCGAVVGLVARSVGQAQKSMSIPATLLVGVAGSFGGGVVGNLLAGNTALHVHTAGFIGSVLGAILVLVLMMFATRATTRRRRLV